jgi:hypothetical protein
MNKHMFLSGAFPVLSVAHGAAPAYALSSDFTASSPPRMAWV